MQNFLRAAVLFAALGTLLPHVEAQPRAARAAATASPAASTASPYDTAAHGMADRAIARGSSADGVVPLLALFAEQARVDPQVFRAELARVATARGLREDRRVLARWMQAVAQAQGGDRPGAARAIGELGFVRDFQIVGPFENDGESGFEPELPAEQARSGEFPFDARFEGKGHEVAFRRVPEGAAWDGYVSLRAFLRPANDVCAVAATTVNSAREQELALYVGAAGSLKVYWNGQLAHTDPARRADFPDRSAVRVAARAGANRVLVKVCNGDGGLGFFLRLASTRGGLASGVTVDASSMPAHQPARAAAARTPLRTDFDELRALAEVDSPSAQALHDYARFLVLAGADDRDERPARQLAARAADLEPTLPRLELAYQLAEERGERMRFVHVAETRFPDEPLTRVMRIKLAATGARPADALPLLEGFAPSGVEGVRAHRLRSEIYGELGLARAALAEARAALAMAPNAVDLLGDVALAESRADHPDQAAAVRERILALRPNDIGVRRAQLEDLVARRRVDELRAPLDAMHTLLRYEDGGLAGLAAIEESIDELEKARDLLLEAIELAPDEPARHVALGRLLLRMNEGDEALVSLRRALELRPQDAETRELLEDVEERERDDERLATPIAEVLERRVRGDGYPYTVLEDLTVNTVYDNGLSSSFRQFVVQVHDVEGARRYRAYGIPYEPSVSRVEVRGARVHRPDGTVLEATQQVEQPMADPAYRMYYDSVNLVVVFPDLEPGDIVELRWRVDDVATTNRLADYWGDLRLLQGGAPVRHLEYVLRTPSHREFYVNAPTLPGLTRERSESDGRNVDRWVANDVPALRGEEHMPGLTEVVPYLHVSTYQAWQDVGRWYWGLVHDQLQPDEDLRRTVRELVADAPDLETKVRRIHDWVVDHTRYVALEFGIHGYKPYRVTQVVRRGFGDCKDKASLLYAMFREAGIDAQLVLVRTRRNGAIAELPASLAIFDHAIAYVPALDLYIDGTAEHSGLRELPEMDQGVEVLHVWPEGAELRRTPVLPADVNVRERTLDVALRADGSATIDATDSVRGNEAPFVRANYEAEGTREERLRRALRQVFPGVELTSATFSDLADREANPTTRWQATVPRFATTDGDGLRIAPSGIEEVVRMLAPTPTRNLPLDLGSTTTYREQRNLVIPQGMRVGLLPAGGVVESRFGRVSVEAREESGRVVTRVELRIAVDRVSPADYPEYRTWVEAADRLFRQRVKLEVQP